MKAPAAPPLEKRRSVDFLAELRERSRAWIPDWDLSAGQGDFGQALLDVAARFSSEIAERLDKAGDKMRAGFLDWLGVRGEAARPARVPVVFKLNDSAPASVDAIAPIRLQASVGATPVVFETEKSLTIIPATLKTIVAADPDNDAYYLPPPDLTSLAAIQQLPTQWKVKSFAPAGGTKLQLMPGVGLSADIVIKINDSQYTITKADDDLVTIDPPLVAAATDGIEVDKVSTFEPFDGTAAKQQEHILYLGDGDLLNVEAAAIIGVQNASALRTGVEWKYWGKATGSDEADWQPLTPLTTQDQPGVLLLKKPAGSMDQLSIEGHKARWIRANVKTIDPAQEPFTASRLGIEINPVKQCTPAQCPPPDGTPTVPADGMANTAPLVLDNLFYPLGKEPHQFDAFYLGSNEAFSKAGAKVQLCIEMADRTFDVLSAVRGINFGPSSRVFVGVGHDRALHLLELDPATGKVNPFHGRPPLYPPSPAFLGSPKPGSQISLDQNPAWRPPTWTLPVITPGFNAAVCAGSEVWVWGEHQNVVSSGWTDFGQISSTTTQVTSLITLSEAGAITLFALRNSKLYSRGWPLPSPDWLPVDTLDGGTTIKLTSIVAVRKFTSSGTAFNEGGTAGLAGIDDSYFTSRLLAHARPCRRARSTRSSCLLPSKSTEL